MIDRRCNVPITFSPGRSPNFTNSFCWRAKCHANTQYGTRCRFSANFPQNYLPTPKNFLDLRNLHFYLHTYLPTFFSPVSQSLILSSRTSEKVPYVRLGTYLHHLSEYLPTYILRCNLRCKNLSTYFYVNLMCRKSTVIKKRGVQPTYLPPPSCAKFGFCVTLDSTTKRHERR